MDGELTGVLRTKEEHHQRRRQLGVALQTLRNVEWCRTRNGAQPFPDALPIHAPCCPTCNGVRGDEFVSRHFAARDLGHKPDCEMDAAIVILANLLAE